MGLRRVGIRVGRDNEAKIYTRAWAKIWGRFIFHPIISSIASRLPGLRVAVDSGGGARTFLPKSDHRSTAGKSHPTSLATFRAASVPPVRQAAPIIASATSATHCESGKKTRRSSQMIITDFVTQPLYSSVLIPLLVGLRNIRSSYSMISSNW